MADKIDFNAIKEGVEAAQTDTTPFLIPGDEPTVVGDANKTQINAHDFEITFRIPQQMEDGSIKQIKKTQEYKSVYITPRMDSTVAKLLTKLMPFIYKTNEDGTVTPYTEEEFKNITIDYSQDIMDVMYETVGTVLKINRQLWDFMLPESVETASLKIILQIPELTNEAETFFG